MVGTGHNAAASQFGAPLGIKINEIKCFDELSMTGRGQRTIGNVQKEPDGSWGPAKVRYPTCILEVGESQSKPSLDNSARLWLKSPGPHISQVIMVKIYPAGPELVFEVWVKAQQDKPEARMEQKVKVIWRDGMPKAEKHLRISFEILFERKPRWGTAEKDILFFRRGT